MALIKCPDCTTEISDAATACVKCGRPLGTATKDNKASATAQGSNAFLFAVIGFALGFCMLWGGCANFRSIDGGAILVYSIGGGIVALLGGILGAVLGKK